MRLPIGLAVILVGLGSVGELRAETDEIASSATNNAVEWKLHSAVQVGGDGIYLSRVASGVDSLLGAESLLLGVAPALGQAVILTRSQIAEAVERLSPDLMPPSFHWAGANQVRVTRKARQLGEIELLELLTTTLQSEVIKGNGQLELRFRTPWPAIAIPDDPITLKLIDSSGIGVSPNCLLKFVLRTERERVGEWQVVVQAQLFRDVWVAQSVLTRGQLVRDADVATERRDVLTLRDPLDPAKAQESGSWEISESVAKGLPLTARSVRLRPVVQRGRLVDVVIREGALNISMKVEVLNDGLPGQTVRVRNPRTKREFAARVQDEQTVILNL